MVGLTMCYLCRYLPYNNFCIGNKPILHLNQIINAGLSDGDILNSRSRFIGQVNNVLHLLRELDSSIKQTF